MTNRGVFFDKLLALSPKNSYNYDIAGSPACRQAGLTCPAKYNAGSSNGRTRDFESRYEGPTPSPAALDIVSGFSEIIIKNV